ncbi:MAG: S8 family serine peptidase [Eubacterium sp.]|nr:S8 family serine peptidase [Eubacterium sp.]
MIKKKISHILLATLFVFGLVAPVSTHADPYVDSVTEETWSDREYVEGEIIVGFLKSKDNELMDSPDCTSIMDGGDVEIVTVDTNGKSVKEAIEEYLAMPDVVFAEPNYIVKPAMDSPDYTPDQYYPTGSTGGIDVPDWNSSSAGSDDVVVALIDSGVDYEHEDLKDVMWNDGLNYPELVAMGGGAHGFNAAAYVNSEAGTTDAPLPPDVDGGFHGTHVAGTIAASWNGKGVSGITNKAKLMAIRTAAKDGAVEMENVVAAYDYLCKAHDAGVNIVVANNSWGGNYMSYASLYAIREAVKRDMIMVFATGNENSDIDKVDSLAYMISDLPNVILVNAADNSEGIAHFSNYGQYTTDVYAPGTEIVSTMPGNLLYANPNYSTPILENDFEADSDLVVEGFTMDGDPISHTWTDGGGYNGSNGYIPADDTGSTLQISSKQDLSASKPKYLTFMVKKDRVYNKTTFGLFVKTTDGESKYIVDGGVVEAGKWNAISLQLPEETDYSDLSFTLSADIVALKQDVTDVNGVIYDNIMLTNDAWPYYKLSGTSMAAPVVTGEVAALAAANPDDTSRKLVARTLGSVKKKDALADKCITGGIVNLRNALEGRYSPVILDAEIKGSEIVVDGEFFTASGTLYVNDSPVNVTEWSDNRIVASVNGLDRTNRMIKVEVRNNNIAGFNSGVNYIPREDVITDYTEIAIPEEMDKMAYPNYSTVSLGDSIYFMTAQADETEFYITEYNTKTGEWKEITKDSTYGYVTGQIVAYKGYIVTIAGKKEGDSYNAQMFLYDPDKEEISWVPFDNLGYYKTSALINYKGDLLIMGGGDIEDYNHFNPNDDIIKVDFKNKKLIKVGTTADGNANPLPCAPIYDADGNVYLGYARANHDIIPVLKKGDDSYELGKAINHSVPHDVTSSDVNFVYSMAYSKEGVLVTGSDVFSGSGEVLSDTYLGAIGKDESASFSNVGKLYSSTVTIRPLGVVHGNNYYVLASCRDSKNLGKSLRYISGYTEIVPEGSTKEEINANVTFKVVNGSWDDGTKADKIVKLTGYNWDRLYLDSKDIPGVGTKPDASYTSGSWDKVPGTDTEITEDTVYTYNYAGADVNKVFYTNTEGDGGVWTKGSGANLRFVYKRSANDETTFSHFTGILVDDVAVDPSKYSAESGSVILNLKSDYLEGLAVGKHTLTAEFDDADGVKVSFTINEKSSSSNNTPAGGNTAKVKTPGTGDSVNLMPTFIILMLSGLGIVVIMMLRRKYRKA